MANEALSPTIISGWLECEHSLTLRLRGATKTQVSGPFAELVRDKGTSHELAVRDRYLSAGLSVLDVDEKGTLDFSQWAERSRGLLATTDADVIYQMPFVHAGIKGIADFLVRVDADEGFSCWEPVDAKLARQEAKPGHLLQLCFYADAVAELTGARPKSLHLALGSGVTETFRLEEFGPYWRRMKHELSLALDDGAPSKATEPEPCRFCEYCDYQKLCERQWRAEDSLIFVADLLRPDRQVLKGAGIDTLAQLASTPVLDVAIPPERLARLHGQAVLQRERRERPHDPMPFTHVLPGDDPSWGHGYAHLPPADEGDVFFDLEGHPLFTAEEGIFFLFGLLYRDQGSWVYDDRWAHTLEDQERRAIELVSFFDERRGQFPGMHVYHYNHTERSALGAMTRDTEASVAFGHQSATGMFVDLRPVIKNAYQVGIETYGLKDLEALTGFERTGEIHAGSGAVLDYEAYLETGDERRLEAIALYNDNDVRSTRALRDWLLGQRPAGARWREVAFDEHENTKDLDALEVELLGFERDSVEHRLGNLIGYWRRERSAQLTPKREQVLRPIADLVDDPDVLTSLEVLEREPSRHNEATGMVHEKATFSFPSQEVAERWKNTSIFLAGADGSSGFGTLSKLDKDEGRCLISWKHPAEEAERVPVSVVADDWVGPGSKAAALLEAARRLLAVPGSLPAVSEEILKAARPRFLAGGGPTDGRFTDELADMVSWIAELDRSVVAVQGPPGTGKTYRGARLIRRLLQEGKRVGITGPSYAALGNLMEAVVDLYRTEGDLDSLSASQRYRTGDPKVLAEAIDYASSNAKGAHPRYQLVAGTSWFFCSAEIEAAPVDVLLVDEAGQVSLADVVAMSLFATNVVLLGDPLQLEQVSNAVHPEGAGSSSLEHLLGGHQTIPDDRGVFLSETRRMHPTICHFISTQIYEDRLTSHPSCALQVVEGHGAGLRWLEAHHEGNATRSVEEAELIAAQIAGLMGTPWTNQHGETAPLRAEDFMVVAPFNDQREEICRVLSLDPATSPVVSSVGTVDKFQGREAPVVFFSMTTSSSEGLSRGAEFLFSRSRLNVAISRARSLAYLVSTDQLLGTRATDVEGMRLIGTLNAFVEEAERA